MRDCFPRSFRGIIRWFHKGWIRIGDPSKPHSEFTPSDSFKYAVTINGHLKYQLPEFQPDPPQYEFQVIEAASQI